MHTPSTPPWSLLLAGGDGTRLRHLTTQIAGDARPKQFCKIVDGETLLDRTRRRADLLTRGDRQVVVLNRDHLVYARGLEHDLAPGRLVVQPSNRGTAVGILYPLLRIRQLAGNVPLAIFPSDHDVSDDGAFVGYAARAIEVVRERPGVVVLLGIEATHPETEYGWIEHASVPLPIDGEAAFPIRRFWEKPSLDTAQVLLSRGALWNSFVMVGWVDTFHRLLCDTVPRLVAAFGPLGGATRESASLVDRIYASVPSISFSDSVLAAAAGRLAAVRVKGIEWSDWGNPRRLVESLRRSGRVPAWLSRVGLASTA